MFSSQTRGDQGDLSLAQFVAWSRTDSKKVSDFRKLFETPLLEGSGESSETWNFQASVGFEKIKVANSRGEKYLYFALRRGKFIPAFHRVAE